MANLDNWWSSLKIAEKERIAKKITGKENLYPKCTAIWENLSMEVEQKVYDHCTNAHGLKLDDWKEGTPYGD